MIDFDELVGIGRDTPAYHEGDDCLTCGAETGESCTLDCDDRGGEARKAVREQVAGLSGEQFEKVLRAAREREARDDETPGFFRAWWAVDDEAAARGLPRTL
ncbi:hypothetical protein [Streptomyces kronopolitis]|uniref:hypothetical protein n=1 Tax=Streptomyces kronopolitis TaxID=1612435 RepID=UPI003D9919B9